MSSQKPKKKKIGLGKIDIPLLWNDIIIKQVYGSIIKTTIYYEDLVLFSCENARKIIEKTLIKLKNHNAFDTLD